MQNRAFWNWYCSVDFGVVFVRALLGGRQWCMDMEILQSDWV